MFPDSSKPSTEPRLNFVCEVLLHLIESNYAATGNKLLYCVMGLIITPSKLLPHLPGADELIFAGLYVQGITFHAKNKKMYGSPWMPIFVTQRATRQWFSRVPSSLSKIMSESSHSWNKVVFTVTNGLFYMYCDWYPPNQSAWFKFRRDYYIC